MFISYRYSKWGTARAAEVVQDGHDIAPGAKASCVADRLHNAPRVILKFI